MTEGIDAKVAGKEIVTPAEPEHAQVINLMEALKQSVAQVQGGGAAPPKKMAKSQPRRAAQRKRKSS